MESYFPVFQSTLPQRERLNACKYRSKSKCFNPRSHKGSDLRMPGLQEATNCFNPRSHKGSDAPEMYRRPVSEGFNPRSHKGSDVSVAASGAYFVVSIHAPTKGATSHDKINGGMVMFQSTLPQRERLVCADGELLIWVFQSTLPQRERRRMIK